jgi:hypothetical protein
MLSRPSAHGARIVCWRVDHRCPACRCFLRLQRKLNVDGFGLYLYRGLRPHKVSKHPFAHKFEGRPGYLRVMKKASGNRESRAE